MAVPFRKISKTRGRMRRTHYKLEAANTVICKNCGASIKPHRVCPECGFYKGKNVIEKEAVEEKVTKTTKAAKSSKATKTEKPAKEEKAKKETKKVTTKKTEKKEKASK